MDKQLNVHSLTHWIMCPYQSEVCWGPQEDGRDLLWKL